MDKKRFWVVLLAIFCLTTTVAYAKPYSSVVVYGDSLSDNGNFFNATGQPGFPYYEGRRSDGPVAVEYLAASLGAPLIDFAWIGATTGVGNYADGGNVTAFGAYNLPGMTTVYNATKGLLTPYISGGLFVVWGGPNDILAPSPLDGNDYSAVVSRALANELAIIEDLKGMGVKTILAPGMPDLGLTPYFNSVSPEFAALGAAITDAFNAGLQAMLPSDVLYYDTAALMRSVVDNPGAYGFTNVTDACFDGSTVCGDPSTYLFFDDFHPTTATHEILGRDFAATVVPLPSTIILFCSGFGCLAVLRRRLSS
ncbi:MAG: Phosphatidylcholine-sterol acyltransferase precursor [Syntrophus sp. PtaU1.Bin208]|nr:MAG: Phosphatidylcholine-sterol acyltransferase precursor [Syntrophus sp. PtaU1.Bin208]